MDIDHRTQVIGVNRFYLNRSIAVSPQFAYQIKCTYALGFVTIYINSKREGAGSLDAVMLIKLISPNFVRIVSPIVYNNLLTIRHWVATCYESITDLKTLRFMY